MHEFGNLGNEAVDNRVANGISPQKLFLAELGVPRPTYFVGLQACRSTRDGFVSLPSVEEVQISKDFLWL